MKVHNYIVAIPFETSIVFEGDEETTVAKIKSYTIEAIHKMGVENVINSSDVHYVGEGEITEEEFDAIDEDDILIPLESLEAFKIMLENGMVELPEEEEK